MTFFSKNKKKIILGLFIILGMAAALWGVNSLRGHGYGTMVKTYIRYWLNPVDLDKYEPLDENMAEWLKEDTLLAHAMGGIGESIYTNSLEAFEKAYENGFRVYEVDLVVTKEGEVVCSHEYLDKNGEVIEYSSFMQEKIEGKYTPVDLRKLIDLMEAYPDVYIMTDIKWDNSMGSSNEDVITLVSALVEEARIRETEDILDRMIIQIYNPKSYEIMQSIYPFKHYVYTLYHYASPIYEEILGFCLENKLPVVAMETSRVSEDIVEYFNAWNIDVLVYTVNDETTANQLRECGVKGIYTDWLVPECEEE